MSWDNVILSVVGGSGVIVAAVMAWRWRRSPILASPTIEMSTPRGASLEAIRTVACLLAAAVIAGLLSVGLGGRLVMRVLAATSGARAQGQLTEAGETVGEITFSGSLGFILFVGVLLPLAASFAFLILRRALPGTAWVAGLIFGVLMLGTLGVADPLAPDNIDFVILSPLWLAVALVAATALLFGVTFTALVARLDATVPRFGDGSHASLLQRSAYGFLVFLLIPFLAVPAAVYIGTRAISHGRAGAYLSRPPIPRIGQAAVLLGAAVALGFVINAGAAVLGS